MKYILLLIVSLALAPFVVEFLQTDKTEPAAVTLVSHHQATTSDEFSAASDHTTRVQYVADGFVKINNDIGGLTANLDPGDRFSRDHDQAGDINGDGVIDLVVGARSDDDGALDAGAVYILFMNRDGTVQSEQKISALAGGFTEQLEERDFFGYGVAGIGDYNNDGIPDIAVSALNSNEPALYVLYLNRDGTVQSYVKNINVMAQGLSAIGDINGDGRTDLVASDPGSDLGGTNIGAIRLLFLGDDARLMPDTTVVIGPQLSGFEGELLPGDQFGGREAAMLGDIDGDGTLELAVGAFMSDGGKGAIWILSLHPTTFNVVSEIKITEGHGGFTDVLTAGPNPNGSAGANFGHALSKAGDFNGDGVPDLITGANQHDDGHGYILYLTKDKTVQDYTRIDNLNGGFDLALEAEERFSRSISYLGALRGDGSIAINIGGGAGAGKSGSLYILFFAPETTLPTQ